MELNQQLMNCHACMGSGDLGGAEQQYQSIILQAPKLGDAHHLGALIARQAARADVALERIGLALAAAPRHHEYLNTKGNIYANLQDELGARDAYSASLAAKPDYLPAAQNLGKLLVEYSDPVAAVEIYKAALKHNNDDQQLKTGLVIALKDALRSEEALEKFKALGGGNEYLHGQILFQLSQHDAALKAYHRALKDPKSSEHAIKNFLQILWMRGEWDSAKKTVEDTLSTAPVETFIAAARSYTLAEDYGYAGQILDRAAQKFGREPFALAERARLKLMSGEYESGYQDALEALTARPGDLKIMADFADCALASGRHNDAMTAAHEALKILPNNQYWIAIKYTAGRAMGQNHHYYTNYDEFVRPFELTPPAGYGSLKEYNQTLKETLNEIHEFNAHPLDQSLRSGIQTPMDLRLVDHPVLKAHFKALQAPIKAYMQHIGNADLNHPLMRRNTGEGRITGSWSAKLTKGGFHVNHVHPEGWISSAYYVDVPDEVSTGEGNEGWIHFGEPPYPVKDHNGHLLSYEKIVKPSVGTLVLFPSYLWHGTIPLKGNKSRMTLPIDVVPA